MKNQFILVTFDAFSEEDSYYLSGTSRSAGSVLKNLGTGSELGFSFPDAAPWDRGGSYAKDYRVKIDEKYYVRLDGNYKIDDPDGSASSQSDNKAWGYYNQKVRQLVRIDQNFGQYQFRVYAQNKLGIRSGYSAFEITIPPPDLDGTFRFNSIGVSNLKSEKKNAFYEVVSAPTSSTNKLKVSSEFIGESLSLVWTLSPPFIINGLTGSVITDTSSHMMMDLFDKFEVTFKDSNDSVINLESILEPIAGYNNGSEWKAALDFYRAMSLNLSKETIQKLVGEGGRRLVVNVKGYDARHDSNSGSEFVFEAEIEANNIPTKLSNITGELFGQQMEITYANSDPDAKGVAVDIEQYSREPSTTVNNPWVLSYTFNNRSGFEQITQEWNKEYVYVVTVNDSFGVSGYYLLKTDGTFDSRSEVNAAGKVTSAKYTNFYANHVWQSTVKVSNLIVQESGANFDIQWEVTDTDGNRIMFEDGTSRVLGGSRGDIESYNIESLSGVALYFEDPYGGSVQKRDYMTLAKCFGERSGVNGDDYTFKTKAGDNTLEDHYDEESGMVVETKDYKGLVVVQGVNSLRLTREANAHLYRTWYDRSSEPAELRKIYNAGSFWAVDAQRKIKFTVQVVDDSANIINGAKGEITYENKPPVFEPQAILAAGVNNVVDIGCKASEKVVKIDVFRRPKLKGGQQDKFNDKQIQFRDSAIQGTFDSRYNNISDADYFNTTEKTSDDIIFGLMQDDALVTFKDNLLIEDDAELQSLKGSEFFVGSQLPGMKGGDVVSPLASQTSFSNQIVEIIDKPPILSNSDLTSIFDRDTIGVSEEEKTHYDYLLVPYDSFGSGDAHAVSEVAFAPNTVLSQDDETGAITAEDFSTPGAPKDFFVGPTSPGGSSFHLEWEKPSSGKDNYNLFYILDKRNDKIRLFNADDEDEEDRRIEVNNKLLLNDEDYNWSTSQFQSVNKKFEENTGGASLEYPAWNSSINVTTQSPVEGYVYVTHIIKNTIQYIHNADGTTISEKAYKSLTASEKNNYSSDEEISYQRTLFRIKADSTVAQGRVEPGSVGSKYEVAPNIDTILNKDGFSFSYKSELEYKSFSNSSTYKLFYWDETRDYNIGDIVFMPKAGGDDYAKCYKAIADSKNVNPTNAIAQWLELDGVELRQESIAPHLNELMVASQPHVRGYFFIQTVKRSGNRSRLHANPTASTNAIGAKESDTRKTLGRPTILDIDEFHKSLTDEFPDAVLLKPNNPFTYKKDNNVGKIEWSDHLLYHGGETYQMRRGKIDITDDFFTQNNLRKSTNGTAGGPNNEQIVRYIYWHKQYGYDTNNTQFVGHESLPQTTIAENNRVVVEVGPNNQGEYEVQYKDGSRAIIETFSEQSAAIAKKDELNNSVPLRVTATDGDKRLDYEVNFNANYLFSTGNPASNTYNRITQENIDGSNAWQNTTYSVGDIVYIMDGTERQYFKALSDGLLSKPSLENPENTNAIRTDVGMKVLTEPAEWQKYSAQHFLHEDFNLNGQETAEHLNEVKDSVLNIHNLAEDFSEGDDSFQTQLGFQEGLGNYGIHIPISENLGTDDDLALADKKTAFQIVKISFTEVYDSNGKLTIPDSVDILDNYTAMNVATIGHANISTASITNAHVTDLSADKITAGVINSHKIEIGGGVFPKVDGAGNLVDSQFILQGDGSYKSKSASKKSWEPTDSQNFGYRPDDFAYGAIASQGFEYNMFGTPGFFISGDGQFAFQTETGGLYLREEEIKNASGTVTNKLTNIIFKGVLQNISGDPVVSFTSADADFGFLQFDEHGDDFFYTDAQDLDKYVGNQPTIESPSDGIITINFGIENALAPNGAKLGQDSFSVTIEADGNPVSAAEVSAIMFTTDSTPQPCFNTLGLNNTNDINEGGSFALHFLNGNDILFTGEAIQDDAFDPNDDFDIAKNRINDLGLEDIDDFDGVNTLIPIAKEYVIKLAVTRSGIKAFEETDTHIKDEVVKHDNQQYRYKNNEAKTGDVTAPEINSVTGERDFKTEYWEEVSLAAFAERRIHIIRNDRPKSLFAFDLVSDGATAIRNGDSSATLTATPFVAYGEARIDVSGGQGGTYGAYPWVNNKISNLAIYQKPGGLLTKYINNVYYNKGPYTKETISTTDVIKDVGGNQVNGITWSSLSSEFGTLTGDENTTQSIDPNYKLITVSTSDSQDSINNTDMKRRNPGGYNGDPDAVRFGIEATAIDIVDGVADYVLVSKNSISADFTWPASLTESAFNSDYKNVNGETLRFIDITDGKPAGVIEFNNPENNLITRQIKKGDDNAVNINYDPGLYKTQELNKTIPFKFIVSTEGGENGSRKSETLEFELKINSAAQGILDISDIKIEQNGEDAASGDPDLILYTNPDGGHTVPGYIYEDTGHSYWNWYDRSDYQIFADQGEALRSFTMGSGAAKVSFSCDDNSGGVSSESDNVSKISIRAEFFQNNPNGKKVIKDTLKIVDATTGSVENWDETADQEKLIIANEDVDIVTDVGAFDAFSIIIDRPFLNFKTTDTVDDPEDLQNLVLCRPENMKTIKLMLGSEDVTYQSGAAWKSQAGNNALVDFELVPAAGWVVNKEFLEHYTANDSSIPKPSTGAYCWPNNGNEETTCANRIRRSLAPMAKGKAFVEANPSEKPQVVLWESNWAFYNPDVTPDANDPDGASHYDYEEISNNFLYYIPPRVTDHAAILGTPSKSGTLEVKCTYTRNVPPGKDQSAYFTKDFTDSQGLYINRTNDGANSPFAIMYNNSIDLPISSLGSVNQTVNWSTGETGHNSRIEAYVGSERMAVAPEYIRIANEGQDWDATVTNSAAPKYFKIQSNYEINNKYYVIDEIGNHNFSFSGGYEWRLLSGASNESVTGGAHAGGSNVVYKIDSTNYLNTAISIEAKNKLHSSSIVDGNDLAVGRDLLVEACAPFGGSYSMISHSSSSIFSELTYNWGIFENNGVLETKNVTVEIDRIVSEAIDSGGEKLLTYAFSNHTVFGGGKVAQPSDYSNYSGGNKFWYLKVTDPNTDDTDGLNVIKDRWVKIYEKSNIVEDGTTKYYPDFDFASGKNSWSTSSSKQIKWQSNLYWVATSHIAGAAQTTSHDLDDSGEFAQGKDVCAIYADGQKQSTGRDYALDCIGAQIIASSADFHALKYYNGKDSSDRGIAYIRVIDFSDENGIDTADALGYFNKLGQLLYTSKCHESWLRGLFEVGQPQYDGTGDPFTGQDLSSVGHILEKKYTPENGSYYDFSMTVKDLPTIPAGFDFINNSGSYFGRDINGIIKNTTLTATVQCSFYLVGKSFSRFNVDGSEIASFALAKNYTTSIPGEMGATPSFRGVWSGENTYVGTTAHRDIVSYQGKFYVTRENGSALAWAQQNNDDIPVWNSLTAYNRATVVSYDVDSAPTRWVAVADINIGESPPNNNLNWITITEFNNLGLKNISSTAPTGAAGNPWQRFDGDFQNVATSLLIADDIFVKKGVVTGIESGGKGGFFASQINESFVNQQLGGAKIYDTSLNPFNLFIPAYIHKTTNVTISIEEYDAISPASEKQNYLSITPSAEFSDSAASASSDQRVILYDSINGVNMRDERSTHKMPFTSIPGFYLGYYDLNRAPAEIIGKMHEAAFAGNSAKTMPDNFPVLELYSPTDNYVRWNGVNLELRGAVINGSLNDARLELVSGVDGLVSTNAAEIGVVGGRIFCGGGYQNHIPDSGKQFGSVIVGGAHNYMLGKFSFIGGGYQNLVAGDFSFIGSGLANVIGGTSDSNHIMYGGANKANSPFNAIIAGNANKIYNSSYSIIGTGYSNKIFSNDFSSIINGESNTIDGDHSYVNYDDSADRLVMNYIVSNQSNPLDAEPAATQLLAEGSSHMDKSNVFSVLTEVKHPLSSDIVNQDDTRDAVNFITKEDFYENVWEHAGSSTKIPLNGSQSLSAENADDAGHFQNDVVFIESSGNKVPVLSIGIYKENEEFRDRLKGYLAKVRSSANSDVALENTQIAMLIADNIFVAKSESAKIIPDVALSIENVEALYLNTDTFVLQDGGSSLSEVVQGSEIEIVSLSGNPNLIILDPDGNIVVDLSDGTTESYIFDKVGEYKYYPLDNPGNVSALTVTDFNYGILDDKYWDFVGDVSDIVRPYSKVGFKYRAYNDHVLRTPTDIAECFDSIVLYEFEQYASKWTSSTGWGNLYTFKYGTGFSSADYGPDDTFQRLVSIYFDDRSISDFIGSDEQNMWDRVNTGSAFPYIVFREKIDWMIDDDIGGMNMVPGGYDLFNLDSEDLNEEFPQGIEYCKIYKVEDLFLKINSNHRKTESDFLASIGIGENDATKYLYYGTNRIKMPEHYVDTVQKIFQKEVEARQASGIPMLDGEQLDATTGLPRLHSLSGGMGQGGAARANYNSDSPTQADRNRRLGDSYAEYKTSVSQAYLISVHKNSSKNPGAGLFYLTTEAHLNRVYDLKKGVFRKTTALNDTLQPQVIDQDLSDVLGSWITIMDGAGEWIWVWDDDIRQDDKNVGSWFHAKKGKDRVLELASLFDIENNIGFESVQGAINSVSAIGNSSPSNADLIDSAGYSYESENIFRYKRGSSGDWNTGEKFPVNNQSSLSNTAPIKYREYCIQEKTSYYATDSSDFGFLTIYQGYEDSSGNKVLENSRNNWLDAIELKTSSGTNKLLQLNHWVHNSTQTDGPFWEDNNSSAYNSYDHQSVDVFSHLNELMIQVSKTESLSETIITNFEMEIGQALQDDITYEDYSQLYKFNTVLGGSSNTISKSNNSVIMGSRDSLIADFDSAISGGLENILIGKSGNDKLNKSLVVFGAENVFDISDVFSDSIIGSSDSIMSTILGSQNRLYGARKSTVMGSQNSILGLKTIGFSTGPSFVGHKKIMANEVNILGSDNKIIVDNGYARNVAIFGSNFILENQDQIVNAYYVGNPLAEDGILTRLFVAADGGTYFTGDVITFALSDKKYKDNIVCIDNAIEKICKIRGVSFDWNKEQNTYEGKDVGVIAQEVESVLPEVVETRASGKAVKYEKITPLLIEAIKEQQGVIETLMIKVEELELAVNKLQ